MATAMGTSLLIAGLACLSGSVVLLGYETYAQTTITVGRAFSYGGIYGPRGAEVPMQIIIDWWFGTSAAGSLFVTSIVLLLLAFVLASRTI